MCHRFTPLSADEVDRVLDYLRTVERAIDQGMSSEGVLPLLASRGVIGFEAVDCYPGSACSVIVAAQGADGVANLGRRDVCWGIEVSWRKGLVFNARIESALRGEGMWREAMDQGRCVVPVRAFYETRNVEAAQGAQEPEGPGARQEALMPARPAPRSQYRFASAADQALLLAGLLLGDRLVVVTTEPNDVVGAVHNRMPLVLTAPEALRWLKGDGGARELLVARSVVALTREKASSTTGPRRARASAAPENQLSLF